MSSISKAAGTADLDRAEQLKRELTEFVTTGPLKEEYERQHKIFFELAGPADEHEAESSIDWFLFDWLDDNGLGAIDHYLDAREDLTDADREILFGWTDSLNSIFEIRSLGRKSLKLKDLESDDEFQIHTSMDLSETPLKRGHFLAARLLPLGEGFIFSGLQFIMPDRKTALEALEMRRSLEALDSPESIEKAQQEQCSAFCDLFGCDELTVRPQNLNLTLARFQQYLIQERRDPETGKTKAEQFEEQFGKELRLPELPPLTEDFNEIGEITILCDEFDGIVLLPEFNKFRRVFESNNLDKEIPDWQDLVWMYVRDPDIPIVAFERVAERQPKRVEKVLRSLLGDKQFSIEHLYAVLLHYKQPVDGLDDLEDDTRLWDMLNGTNGESDHPARATTNKPVVRKADGGKPKASAAKRPQTNKKPAAKAGAKKSSAGQSPSSKKSASAKSTASKSSKAGTKKSAPGKAASKKPGASTPRATSSGKKTVNTRGSRKR